MFFEQAIIIAYLTTIVSEICIILLIQKPVKILSWILGIFLIHCLTHPIALYLFHIEKINYILVEIGVFIVEALWYYFAFSISKKRAIVLSIIANLTSIILGILIRTLFNV